MKYKKLNPLLHAQLRLAIMSIVVSEENVDFTTLKELTEASSGNLSVQISKLQEAGYIKVDKSFKNNFPRTTIRITKKGMEAYEQYIEDLQEYLNFRKK